MGASLSGRFISHNGRVVFILGDDCMIKIGLLAIVAVAITMFIKQTKPEYAYIFSLCVGVFLFMLCMDSFLNIADMIRLVSSQIENADVYIYTLL